MVGRGMIVLLRLFVCFHVIHKTAPAITHEVALFTGELVRVRGLRLRCGGGRGGIRIKPMILINFS